MGLKELKRERRELMSKFEGLGGRSVELAEAIDSLDRQIKTWGADKMRSLLLKWLQLHEEGDPDEAGAIYLETCKLLGREPRAVVS